MPISWRKFGQFHIGDMIGDILDITKPGFKRKALIEKLSENG